MEKSDDDTFRSESLSMSITFAICQPAEFWAHSKILTAKVKKAAQGINSTKDHDNSRSESQPGQCKGEYIQVINNIFSELK